MTNTNTEVLNSHQRLALTGSFPHMLLVKIPQSQRLNEHVSLQIKTFIFYDILASRQQCRCFLCILVLWMSKKISQQPSKCVCVFLCACMGQSVCLTLTAILCGTSWSSCWWMWNRGGYHISDIWLWSSAASWCSVKMRQSSLHAPDTRTHTHTLTLGLLRFLRPDSVVHSSSLSQGMTLTDQSQPFLPPKFHILQVSSWIFIYPEAGRFSFGEPVPAPNPLIEVISWVWNAEAASEQDDELNEWSVLEARESKVLCNLALRLCSLIK